jgi:bisanhydrobacterioruberin hydratase
MKNILLGYKRLNEKEVTKFIIIFYLVGAVGFLVPISRALFEWLIPLSILTNLSLLFFFHQPRDKRHLIIFLLIWIVSFLIEAIGTNTGMIFGEYSYGKSLGIGFFNTPILIGANWLVLIYGALSIVRLFPFLNKFRILATAFLMLVFDWLMEPVAIKTGMWFWLSGTIPHLNYIMWFAISAFFAGLLEYFRIKTNKPVAARLFLAQLFFFTLLNLFLP